jgi:hypothetical protein
MGKRARHPDQADLFDVAEAYPVLAPRELTRALDFNRQLANAMALAIRQSGKARELIAAEMTEILGYEDSAVTVAQLNAYTSAARETHTISLVRFKAFVRATGVAWLWAEVLRDEGLTILEGDEARLARASMLRKQGEQLLAAAEAELDLAPTTVRVPRGRR